MHRDAKTLKAQQNTGPGCAGPRTQAKTDRFSRQLDARDRARLYTARIWL
jgi:hypothetical protein